MKEIVKFFGKSRASSERGMVSEKGQDPESESNEERENNLSLVSRVRNDRLLLTSTFAEILRQTISSRRLHR